MNEFTGSILELNDKQAIVMTNSCDFVSIERHPEMFVGQQLKFKKSDITKTTKNYLKYFALAASIFVIALFTIFYSQLSVSSNVYAYIDVDINPSVEFSIDKNAKVLGLKPLNSDAQKLLDGLKLVDLPLKAAITEVIKASKQLGFISTGKENAILISASIYDDKNYKLNSLEEVALNNILTDISSDITFEVGNENIKPEILKVTPENRKSAIKNDLSMGRYALYSKIKAGNIDITVEKAKTERVSDMLDKAKIKNSKKSKVDDSNSKNKASENKDLKDTKIKNDSKNSDSNHTNSKSYNSENNKSDKNKSSGSRTNNNKDKNNSNSSDSKELLPPRNDKSGNASLVNDKDIKANTNKDNANKDNVNKANANKDNANKDNANKDNANKAKDK